LATTDKTDDSSALETATAHWVQLLGRLLEAKTHRPFYATAQAYANRLKRRSPEELGLVSDSLRTAISQTAPRNNRPTSGEIRYLLEFLLELSIEMSYSSSEERAEQQWIEFSKTDHFKTIITLLCTEKMTGKSLSEQLKISRSRVSQILSTMQLANLIQFTQQGQFRCFSLTEMGKACASHLRLDQTLDGNVDRLEYTPQFTDTKAFVTSVMKSKQKHLKKHISMTEPSSKFSSNEIKKWVVEKAKTEVENNARAKSKLEDYPAIPAFTFGPQGEFNAAVG